MIKKKERIIHQEETNKQNHLNPSTRALPLPVPVPVPDLSKKNFN